MKKLFYIPAVLAFAVFAACGPSAAEKRAKEVADSTRVADSISAVNAAAEAKAKAASDSIAAVEAAAAAKAQATADSIAAASAKPAKKK